MAPDRREVQAAVDSLRALLTKAPNGHIGFWVTTMANSMAMRQGQTSTMASRTDGWLLACGELPTDLWTSGCTELLRTKTFMPSPGELMAIVGRKFEERRRMLKRAEWLLGEGDPKKPKPFVQEPLTVRLRTIRDAWRRRGDHARAASTERELAVEEGRDVEAWAQVVERRPTLSETAHEALRAYDPEMAIKVSPTARRCAELAAARRASELEPVDEYAP